MSSIRRRSAVVLALSLFAARAAAQLDYRLAFEPGGERWHVEARLPGRGEEALDFWIPLWTPGAYHVAEYGRFVKELTASDESGAALAVERREDEPSHFIVHGGSRAKEIVLRYEAEPISRGLFSHGIIDVEANRIARDYAYVNPVSLFGFVPARRGEEVRLALALPEKWRAATALEQDEQGRYVAPSYARFEDSPLLFSPTLQTAEFEVDGKPHRVSVQGKSAEETRKIAAGCKRIVEAGSQLMEGLPYDHYQFLYGFVQGGGGSGLEHSFSTLILVDPALPIAEDEHSFWGITAHEYFHLWCAERIHVEGIHHPDYTRPFATGTLWVNEGITEYFCRHLLLHAGFYDEAEFLGSFFDGGHEEATSSEQSWTEVSRAAAKWNGMQDLIVFARAMYSTGPRTIFALDLAMRRATKGERGVLDLLRYLNATYARKDRGFGEDELDDILAAVAGPEVVAFYGSYIDGKETPDPARFLDVIGFSAEGGHVRSIADPDAAQLAARRDFFSISGKP